MRLALTLTAALAAGVAGCAPRPAAMAPSTPGGPPPGVVSVDAARQLIDGGARVVDVRTPREFAAGHVPGALNIPFDELGRRAGELGDPAAPVVLYCRSGRRSGIAAKTLHGLGFEKVYDFQRFDDWQAAGQQTASARTSPAPQ